MDDRLLASIKRDAKIINALHVARYALVIHDGCKFIIEGTQLKTDFSEEINSVDEVLIMLGLDPTQPLPAPVKNRERDEDDDQ